MARRIVAGIDIGTYQVKVVLAEHVRGRDRRYPKIIGTGQADSKGLRHGYIINSSDVIRSIRQATRQAERMAGAQVRKAYISVGGIGLDEVRSKGSIIVPRADQEVTDLDIEAVLKQSEENMAQKSVNKRIVHVIPLKYRLDGQDILGTSPLGLKGTKLEIETLFVTSFEQHLNDLIQAVEDAGIEVIDVMASPLAGSLVTLTRTQKIAGVVVANIGAETVSIAIFENNIPISVKVFPRGSNDITNDIALGLKVPIEEAERMKLGSLIDQNFSQKELDDIVLTRLRDIFDLIEAHLKKIGKNGLLPAGIVLTGGGSGVATIEDLAKASLKLPTRMGSIHASDQSRALVRDSSWAVAYGLCIWGFTADEEPLGLRLAKKTGNSLLSWVRQFLP